MVLGRDLDPFGALQQPPDGVHRLRPRQGSSRAGVDSPAEREVVPGIRPLNVELARVGEHPRVAARRAVQQQDHGAGG